MHGATSSEYCRVSVIHSSHHKTDLLWTSSIQGYFHKSHGDNVHEITFIKCTSRDELWVWLTYRTDMTPGIGRESTMQAPVTR